MKKQISIKHKNRAYVCEVTYTGCPSCFGADDINISCVKVLEIKLSDGTIISREWFADRGWMDTVDFLLWDEIEWDAKELLYES
jgi:hypothetical protein